jgi:hypothetical protein
MRSYKLIIITLLFIFLVSLSTSVSTKAEPVSAVIDYEGIPEGEIVDQLYSGYGISGAEIEGFVTVFGYNPEPINPADVDKNHAMIFDATCTPGGTPDDCTGNDSDLFKPEFGNTLIISEDLDSTDPDDADVVGAVFGFEYSELGDGSGAFVESLEVHDVEEDETEDARMFFYEGGLDGAELFSIDIPETGDGNSLLVPINVDDVDAIRIDLQGSGTINNIRLSAEPTAVELISFKVDRVGDGTVDLSWATAAEIDNLGFYIYRSNDNNLSHAEQVHFEPAFGGSGGHTYSFTDTPPDEGPYWYWLSDIDTFGKETFHMPEVVRTLHSNFNYLPILIGR